MTPDVIVTIDGDRAIIESPPLATTKSMALGLAWRWLAGRTDDAPVLVAVRIAERDD
jgi:hypothetical protein